MSSSAAENEPTAHESTVQRPSGIAPSGTHGEAEAPSRVRPSLNVAELDCFSLSPRAAYHPLLANAYEAWRDGWREALGELSAATTDLRSNDFTRQDQINVLSARGACVAVSAVRHCDLSQPMWLEDSYFQHWPLFAIKRLAERQICISSNTLIVREWRGARIHPRAVSAVASVEEVPEAPLSLKTVLIALAVRAFVASSAELLVGVSRNDRAMDRVAHELGFKTIGAIEVHGVKSDVVIVERRDVPPLHPIIEDLWSRRQAGAASWFPERETG